jgi:hypothetical protein
MACHKCGHRACVDCKVLYYDEETCDMFQQKTKDKEKVQGEDSTYTFIKHSTNQCPECKMHIEKDGGCDYMICK